MATMLPPGRHLTLHGTIGGELVGHDPLRRPTLPLQKTDRQPLGRPLVPTPLQDLVEHDLALVNRPPEPMDLAPDHRPDFIEVPDVARARRSATNNTGDGRAELGRSACGWSRRRRQCCARAAAPRPAAG